MWCVLVNEDRERARKYLSSRTVAEPPFTIQWTRVSIIEEERCGIWKLGKSSARAWLGLGFDMCGGPPRHDWMALHFLPA